MDTYYLYSIRSNGWFTRSSTYGSDIKEAKEFDRDSALAQCRKHVELGNHRMIPVRKEDMRAI